MPDNDPELCADCQTPLLDDPPYRMNCDDLHVCDECGEKYCACADCGEVILQSEAHSDDDGNDICESCAEDYRRCDDCGEETASENLTHIDGSDTYVCETCLTNEYEKCEDCGHYFPAHDAHSLGEGGYICPFCNDRGDYFTCESCHGLYHDSQIHLEDDSDSYYCASCYTERDNKGRAIYSYPYKPEWDYHITDREFSRGLDENPRNTFFLGVELEVENKSNGIHSNEDTARTIKDTVSAICKYDGSIDNGFEIVFHPQTYQYAVTTGREGIEKCLETLRDRYFRGHNYGGMHVHVSLNAFSRLHLVKFHQLFKNADYLLTQISQRKRENLNQWANFANLGDAPGISYSRYAALNYTADTVEVRIFNSNVRTDRFFKNLETVQAAIEYTKQASLRELYGNNFLKYIMENRSRFRNLATFLVEKHESMATPAASPRTIRQVQKRITRHAG